MSSITDYELTGHIPLFIREGAAILVQDVSKASSTKQLDNMFTLYTGFSYKSSSSSSSSQVYEATGRILSLEDYNSNSKI